jgi:hypothetical protein
MRRVALLTLVIVLELMSGAASAATLIEMSAGARPLRLVVDRPQQRVLIESADRHTWFDLNGGFVYHRAGDAPAARAHARYRPGHHEPPPYRIERFGPGPIVAGQASTYEVLFAEDRICAETMRSAWVLPFLDPAIRAIGLIQQTLNGPPGDPCAGIPFATYAAGGWPLIAGKADRPTLVTNAIAFDYAADPAELTPPAAFVDVSIEQLRDVLAGYGF